ncbi:MAG: hypothetical protein NWR94_09075, partial [Cyanobium sp. MAG_237]|nr:hypothetical protein [Cyanobium sp. MAG_237]
PELNLGLEIAQLSQRALDALIKRCGLDEGCNGAFPNLRAGVDRLIQDLKAKAIAIEYEDVQAGQNTQQDFGIMQLAVVIRLSLYQDELSALLPVMLHEAYANDNFAPLARSAALFSKKMQHGMHLGMHNSVVCAEDFAYYSENQGREQGN